MIFLKSAQATLNSEIGNIIVELNKKIAEARISKQGKIRVQILELLKDYFKIDFAVVGFVGSWLSCPSGKHFLCKQSGAKSLANYRESNSEFINEIRDIIKSEKEFDSKYFENFLLSNLLCMKSFASEIKSNLARAQDIILMQQVIMKLSVVVSVLW